MTSMATTPTKKVFKWDLLETYISDVNVTESELRENYVEIEDSKKGEVFRTLIEDFSSFILFDIKISAPSNFPPIVKYQDRFYYPKTFFSRECCKSANPTNPTCVARAYTHYLIQSINPFEDNPEAKAIELAIADIFGAFFPFREREALLGKCFDPKNPRNEIYKKPQTDPWCIGKRDLSKLTFMDGRFKNIYSISVAKTMNTYASSLHNSQVISHIFFKAFERVPSADPLLEIWLRSVLSLKANEQTIQDLRKKTFSFAKPCNSSKIINKYDAYEEANTNAWKTAGFK